MNEDEIKELKTLIEDFVYADNMQRSLFNSDIRDLEISERDADAVKQAKQVLGAAGVILEHEAQHGGEGEGEEYWSIYSFAKDGEKLYVKFDGYYQSYDGSELEQWFYVEPKEVMVVQYFPVK